MATYDHINREERALCSHLFRLLHETKQGSYVDGGLDHFLRLLRGKSLLGLPENACFDPNALSFSNVAIYSEAALIRDAYQSCKPNVQNFMDTLTRQVIAQEGVGSCTLYSELPEPLRDPSMTHPRQIRFKARDLGIVLSRDELRVYGAVQAMFNAKPDLAITVDQYLLVIEAKLTEPFDQTQLLRTAQIAQVWSSDLLRGLLGFKTEPMFAVVRLGASRYNPDISWSEVATILPKFYCASDRTAVVFKEALGMLRGIRLEATV